MKHLYSLVLALMSFQSLAARIDWTVTDIEAEDIYSNVGIFPMQPGYYENEPALAEAQRNALIYWACNTLTCIGTDNTISTYGDGISKSCEYYFVLVPYSDRDSYLCLKADGVDDYIYDTSLGETSPGVYELSMTLFDGAEKRQFGAIPEPTSAMLLALGLCGLALRRRRA